jgi:hypothetical protein
MMMLPFPVVWLESNTCRELLRCVLAEAAAATTTTTTIASTFTNANANNVNVNVNANAEQQPTKKTRRNKRDDATRYE